MFNFTTQNIINSLVEGKNYFVVPVDETDDSAKSHPYVRFGNVRFSKSGTGRGTIRWWKQPYTPENLASVTFDLTSIIASSTATSDEAGNYRFVFYIKLHNSDQSSVYSNSLVYKGKPLFLEFSVKAGETKATVAARIKSLAAKYQVFFVQEQLLNVNVVDSVKVKFTGVDGHQMLTKAVLQKYNPNAKAIDCCTNEGDYEDIITGVPRVYELTSSYTVKPITSGKKAQYITEDGTTASITGNLVSIEPGIPAFGDYDYIMRNLRIPTTANTGYWAVTKNELPIVGGTYDQYTIELCKERDGIAGEVVGMRATSVTTHVFYVISSESSKFEKLLSEALDHTDTTDDKGALDQNEATVEQDDSKTVSNVIVTPYDDKTVEANS